MGATETDHTFGLLKIRVLSQGIAKICDKTLDFRPQGIRGKRYVRTFASKAEALQFKNSLLSGKLETQAEKAIGDNLRLNDLIHQCYELHGRSLKSSLDTKIRLLKLSKKLGNPPGRFLDPELFAQYRNKRIDKGISPATLNRELITLKALFRELKRLSVITINPQSCSFENSGNLKPNSLT